MKWWFSVCSCAELGTAFQACDRHDFVLLRDSWVCVWRACGVGGNVPEVNLERHTHLQSRSNTIVCLHWGKRQCAAVIGVSPSSSTVAKHGQTICFGLTYLYAFSALVSLACLCSCFVDKACAFVGWWKLVLHMCSCSKSTPEGLELRILVLQKMFSRINLGSSVG